MQKLVIQFDNKLEAQWAEPVSLTFQSVLRKLYTEPSIGGSNQILVHLILGFRGEDILEITRKNNFLW